MTGLRQAGILWREQGEPVPEKIIRQYLFDRPGRYHIRVQGSLDRIWLVHLDGLEISTGPWGSYSQATQINGWLADQTALAGLLGLLNELGLVILTVERLQEEEKTE
jgi:hypothetical protein